MGDERKGTPLPDGPWVTPVAKEKSKREGKRNDGKKEEERERWRCVHITGKSKAARRPPMASLRQPSSQEQDSASEIALLR